MRAEQGGVEPAELARGDGGKFGVEIGRRAKNGASDILFADVVFVDQALQHLTGRIENRLTRVFVRSGGATDSSAGIGHRILH